MGLIRKSLAVGTVGVVRPSSKKQRVAKATQKAAEQSAVIARQAEARAAAQAQEEFEFRYATDPAYRKFIDDKRAAEAEAARLERQRRDERNAAIKRASVRTVLATAAVIAIPIVALTVWLPQVALSRARHESFKPWRRDSLTRPFRG